MAKLAAKKKPTKPDAPKKPSSRSKTGNAECSQAASNWQLSIRGKATLNPGTYQTLAKCRALSKSGQMADAQGRTGKLSDQGAAALKGRLQSRFDSGLITQKSRNERLNMLLKQRSERGNAVVGKGITVNKADFERRIGGPAKPQAEEQPKPKSSLAEGRTDRALDKTMGFNGVVMTRRKAVEDRVKAGAKIELSPKGTRRLMNPDGSFLDESQISKTAMDYAERLATPPKPAAPARYSLGGKLAPGRGTEERKKTADFLRSAKKSGLIDSSKVGRTSLMVAQDIRSGATTPEELTSRLVDIRTKAFLEVPSEYRIRKGKKISERMDARLRHHTSIDITARHALGEKGYENYAKQVEEKTREEIAYQSTHMLGGYDKQYRPVKDAYKLIYPSPLSGKPKRKATKLSR